MHVRNLRLQGQPATSIITAVCAPRKVSGADRAGQHVGLDRRDVRPGRTRRHLDAFGADHQPDRLTDPGVVLALRHHERGLADATGQPVGADLRHGRVVEVGGAEEASRRAALAGSE